MFYNLFIYNKILSRVPPLHGVFCPQSRNPVRKRTTSSFDSSQEPLIRRTCAKLCHVDGGELERIQFLLGHASVLTTKRHLGCKQNLEEPVNDRFGCLVSKRLDLR